MVNDYKDLVAMAEKAVAAVSDPMLKQIAFQKILDDLLSQGDGTKTKSKSKGLARRSKTTRSKIETRSKTGPKAYVEELVSDGFFDSKKSPNDVLAELADRGHHIAATDARVILLRMCKTKMLRRKKEGKTYLYSNW